MSVSDDIELNAKSCDIPRHNDGITLYFMTPAESYPAFTGGKAGGLFEKNR